MSPELEGSLQSGQINHLMRLTCLAARLACPRWMQDEGHIFVYNVFPFPLPKYLYWTFVGVLFRESAPKIIRHYYDLVRPRRGLS